MKFDWLICIVLGSIRFYMMALLLPAYDQKILGRLTVFALATAGGLMHFETDLNTLRALGYSGGDFVWLVIREIAVGLMLALPIALGFYVISLGTGIIASASGMAFAMGSPLTDDAGGSPYERLFAFIVIIVFFGSDLADLVFGLFAHSYTLLPVFEPDWSPYQLAEAVQLAITGYFVAGVTFAGIYLMVFGGVDMALGIAGRFAPQIQVFFMAMPIKAFLTAVLICIFIQAGAHSIYLTLESGLDAVFGVFQR